MTEDLILAHNQRFNSALRTVFLMPRPGLFTLWQYGGTGKLLYCGENIDEMLQEYDLRPQYIPPVPRARTFAGGLDLSDLEIDL